MLVPERNEFAVEIAALSQGGVLSIVLKAPLDQSLPMSHRRATEHLRKDGYIVIDDPLNRNDSKSPLCTVHLRTTSEDTKALALTHSLRRNGVQFDGSDVLDKSIIEADIGLDNHDEVMPHFLNRLNRVAGNVQIEKAALVDSPQGPNSAINIRFRVSDSAFNPPKVTEETVSAGIIKFLRAAGFSAQHRITQNYEDGVCAFQLSIKDAPYLALNLARSLEKEALLKNAKHLGDAEREFGRRNKKQIDLPKFLNSLSRTVMEGSRERPDLISQSPPRKRGE